MHHSGIMASFCISDIGYMMNRLENRIVTALICCPLCVSLRVSVALTHLVCWSRAFVPVWSLPAMPLLLQTSTQKLGQTQQQPCCPPTEPPPPSSSQELQVHAVSNSVLSCRRPTSNFTFITFSTSPGAEEDQRQPCWNQKLTSPQSAAIGWLSFTFYVSPQAFSPLGPKPRPLYWLGVLWSILTLELLVISCVSTKVLPV